jgi:hypothetical protein
MQVHVEEFDRVQVTSDQTGFLERFAKGGRVGALGLVNVTAGLDPDPKKYVTVQYETARGDREGRRREVVGILMFGEGITWPLESLEHRGGCVTLSLIDRFDPLNLLTQRGE